MFGVSGYPKGCKIGDGHLAGFGDPALVGHLHISRFLAWKNDIGSMGRSAEEMHGAHGIFTCTPLKGFPWGALLVEKEDMSSG